MKLINNICFYLNHTRDVTMYAGLFTKFEDKKICFLFNNLFKEKKDNNLNEYLRIKKFLKKNYPKYNEIIIRNLKFTTQVFFDAILSGSKVYYQNSKDTGVQSLINKIFKKDFNLDYNSDDRVKDFSEIRDIVKEKHTGDNRAKTILSQIKGVK